MPSKLIKDGAIVDNQWLMLGEDDTTIPEGKVIVPLALWQQHKDTLKNRGDLGIWLDSDQPPQNIADSLNSFELVAINFPAFADGRGFSYGRELRDRHHYQGELRAVGEFISDQLYFLRRCGFNAFALQGEDLQSALDSFGVFTESYQASIDQPLPLFKRR
jgi:uncharacterized protein (DUF934 family)